MPKLTRSLPKYRHHKASGQAVVTIGGKDHYLGRWNSKASKEEYNRVVADWLAQERESPGRTTSDPTITELVWRYWEHAQVYYVKKGRPTGTLDSIRAALRFLRKEYGPTLAAEFGPTKLKALQGKMARSGLARSYVNANIGRIKQLFTWSVSEELIPVAVREALLTVPGLRKGRSGAREPEPVRPVSEEVIDETIAWLPPIVADMVRFQRLVGCRPNEVCIIRPCDVDRSSDVWAYKPGTHKTEHRGGQRVIAIGPRAQAMLTPYLLRPADAFCFSPAESRQKWLDEM
jgi:integrase